MNIFLRFTVLLALLIPIAVRAEEPDKPKVAVFPLAGSASQDERDKVGFSLRTKLDRDGHFEPIDGPTMIQLASGQEKPVDLDTAPQKLIDMAQEESPKILIWGNLDKAEVGWMLTVKTLDLRNKDAKPAQLQRAIKQPTDMRFMVEEILGSINGVGAFSHPVEDAVHHDAQSDELFKKNLNLLTDGDFASEGSWMALLRSEKYPAPISSQLPGVDKVVIYKQTDKAIGDNITVSNPNALAMRLSKDVAESNGLACLSAPFDIQPHTRYRIQFQYKSDGPTLHVFVKGYKKGKDIAGQDADVQNYECQVPPSGGTHGQWQTVTCDMNPQSPGGDPTFLKVDLYAYLSPGTVLFRDVQVKAVGEVTRKAVDDAIKPPAP